MAEEKEETAPVISRLINSIVPEVIVRPQKMKSDNKENKQICNKCGEKWCYKKWEYDIQSDRSNL